MNEIKKKLDEQKTKLDIARQIFKEEEGAYNKLLKEYQLSLGIGVRKHTSTPK